MKTKIALLNNNSLTIIFNEKSLINITPLITKIGISRNVIIKIQFL